MEIAREIQEVGLDLSHGSCVTLGNFDGVHVGHQRLIDRVVRKARAAHLPSVVVTFCPHPLRVLVGPTTPPFITVRDRKLDLIEHLGVDLTMLINFTRELAALSPRAFVSRYLVDWLHVKELVIGYDYAFGKGRAGRYEVLKELGQELGFGVERLEPVIVDGAIVSSTRIRDLIREGDVWAAKNLLGRFFTVRGQVVHGKDRGGKLLGFPTANLLVENELAPKPGVYAVWAVLPGVAGEAGGGDERVLPAVCNIGRNPTFRDMDGDVQDVSVEVHILDFAEEIYGSDFAVCFVQRIRDEVRFPSLDALKTQIGADAALGRRILESSQASPESSLPIGLPVGPANPSAT